MFGALSSRFRRKQPPPSRAAALERLKGLVGSGNRSGSLPRGGSDRRRKRKPIPQPDRPLRAGEILEQAEDGTVSPAPGFSRERARQQTQKPLAALFHLPYGGGDWPERIAGVARNTEAVVWAMVELLPADLYWLDERRYPDGEWRAIHLAGKDHPAMRRGYVLAIENPPRGFGAGHWRSLRESTP